MPWFGGPALASSAAGREARAPPRCHARIHQGLCRCRGARLVAGHLMNTEVIDGMTDLAFLRKPCKRKSFTAVQTEI